MHKDLAVGSVINTKNGKATIKKIGPIERSENSKYGWAMLTLDLKGQTVYCPAREDELASYFAAQGLCYGDIKITCRHCDGSGLVDDGIDDDGQRHLNSCRCYRGNIIILLSQEDEQKLYAELAKVLNSVTLDT